MPYPSKSSMLIPACCAALAAAGAVSPALAVDGTWVAANGSWGTGANWTSNPNFPTGGGSATFNQSFAGTRTITLNVPVTLSQITFATGSSYAVTAGGGSITLVPTSPSTGSATLGATGGLQTITAPLAGGDSTNAIGVVKTGNGTLALGGNNASLNAAFDVQAGALRLTSSAALGAAQNLAAANGGVIEIAGGISTPTQFLALNTPLANAPNGAVRSLSGGNTWNGTWVLTSNPAATTSVGVDAGSTLTLNGPIVEAATPGLTSLAKVGGGTFTVTQPLNLTGLAVNAGTVRTSTATASRLGSLTLAGTPAAPAGRYDVTNGKLVIASANVDTVRQQIRSAFAPAGGGAAWSGNGITTSNGNASQFALGYGRAGDFNTSSSGSLFAGVSGINANDTLVAYTLFGDANLDGRTDALDFSLLVSNFGKPGVWRQGDLNYDGRTDALDFSLLVSNFGRTLPGTLTANAAPRDWARLATFGESIGVPVPEPVGMGLLAVAGGLVLGRGRRRAAKA